MSDLGPLPEQHVRDDRIPRLDLRERIRLDHHVPPVTPLGKRVEQNQAEANAKGNEMLWAVALVIAVMVLWMWHPAWVLIAVLTCGVVVKLLR